MTAPKGFRRLVTSLTFHQDTTLGWSETSRWCSSTSRAWSITQDRANRTYYPSFDPLPAGLSCRALLQRMNLASPAAHRARGAVPEPDPYWHQQTWAGARNPRVSAKRASDCATPGSDEIPFLLSIRRLCAASAVRSVLNIRGLGRDRPEIDRVAIELNRL